MDRIVRDATLNELWRFVATGSGSIIKGAYWHKKSFQGQITDDVAGPIKSPVPPDFGKVKILSLGRTGANLESPPVPADNAARTARIRAVQMADNHVRLSQQMLGGSLLGFYDIPLLGVICQHVINNKQLSIIMSDTGASTQSKDDYYGDGIEATAKWLASIIAVMSRLNRDKLIALLTRNVHLAPIRIYDKQPGDPEAKSWMWRRTKEHLETKIRIEPANHAKVFIYDDDGFFFGSDNAYKMPLSNLGMQEFGFMVSDKEETRKFINNYWDKAWYYSSQFEFKDWENIVSEVFANPTDVELLLRDIDLF